MPCGYGVWLHKVVFLCNFEVRSYKALAYGKEIVNIKYEKKKEMEKFWGKKNVEDLDDSMLQNLWLSLPWQD